MIDQTLIILVTRLITEFSSDFKTFYNRIVDDMHRYRDKRAFEIDYTMQNTFDVSCVPWINYSSCDLHVYDSGSYLAPVITWGKYTEKNGKHEMPLTMQIHHAVADGFHIGRFFNDIRSAILALIETLR